jgi:hypothetical protein
MESPTRTQGTLLVKCPEISDFVKALTERAKPDRLYTTFIGHIWMASFVTGNDSVYEFMTSETGNGFDQRIANIYSTLRNRQVPEVDGYVTVSPRNGHIYQWFDTEDKDDEVTVAASFAAWIKAAMSLNKDSTEMIFYKREQQSVVDLRQGRVHLVTYLDNHLDRKVDTIVENLGIRQRKDYTDAVDWYDDICKR